jgi:hypothetical protein
MTPWRILASTLIVVAIVVLMAMQVQRGLHRWVLASLWGHSFPESRNFMSQPGYARWQHYQTTHQWRPR